MRLNEINKFQNQKAGTVCVAKYMGDDLTIRIMSSDKTITISKGAKIVVSFCGNAPFDENVMLFGRYGNFKDENGCYHDGSLCIKTSDIEVDDDAIFYEESEIINNLSLIGLTENEIHNLTFINTHAPIEQTF